MTRSITFILAFLINSFIKTANGQAPLPPDIPRPVYYTGNLTISIEYLSQQFDACDQKMHIRYLIRVTNASGSSQVNFDVKALVNQSTANLYDYNSSRPLTEGRFHIVNLAVGTSTTVNLLAKRTPTYNPELPDVKADVSIVETPTTTSQVHYFITDRTRNTASVSNEFVYVNKRASSFDAMSAKIIRQRENTEETLICLLSKEDAANALTPWAEVGVIECDGNKIVCLSNYNNIRIKFVKAGCFDSGIPYYHMKVGDDLVYPTENGRLTIGYGTYPSLKNAWVFARAMAFDQERSGFHIYNAEIGNGLRLQYTNDNIGEHCFPRSSLKLVEPSNSKTQVFARY